MKDPHVVTHPCVSAAARARWMLAPLALALSTSLAMPVAHAQQAPAPESAAHAPLQISAIHIQGASAHPAQGLDTASLQARANQALSQLSGGHLPAQVTLAQLKGIADELTRMYQQAGFLVARAYVPAQKIGADGSVRIDIVEGTVGKVTLEGNTRYADDLLLAPALGLQGAVLRQQDLQSALLRLDDLPGVTVTSLLKPGALPGQTDVVLQAHQSNPVQYSIGANNYGTDSTGRYRAQVGLDWNSPLGLGDHLGAAAAYAIDPSSSWLGNLNYSIPIQMVDGLSASASYTRSRISLDTGAFAALGLQGPTSQTSLGLDWTFLYIPQWRGQSWLHLVHETSSLEALGITLSKQDFDVAEAGINLRHVSPAQHAIDVVQLSLRQALHDGSQATDYLYPAHNRHFLLARLNYARLQGLTPTQRLKFSFDGQYTRDALTPLEQFSLGGPTSVRAFSLSEALGDRGFSSSLEYQVDGPRSASPLGGRSWNQLVTFNAFYDYGRVYPNHANRLAYPAVTTFQGPGAGMTVHLPHGLSLDLSAAKSTGSTDPDDGKNVRYWASVGFTF
ncbi:ShlB/FhaC/HecB family hemolysin secretion/activation protein [Xanthomonas massiliensis]|uniref:ShlB/FhaC/HecB family hemolysin secretion/activation protein n=1 Tax=Xanthomonas massiliensis TaxID=1720302 RepID=UPI000824EED0|nr:ShlB/FhaC/HecB family hemolysin secretion/activation protein [Xanthomonas massiliensis]